MLYLLFYSFVFSLPSVSTIFGSVPNSIYIMRLQQKDVFLQSLENVSVCHMVYFFVAKHFFFQKVLLETWNQIDLILFRVSSNKLACCK